MRSTVQKINTSIDLSKNSKVKGIFVLRVNSSYFNFSASYTMVFLKSLVCLSPWLLGHFRSETIAFSTGYSVVCCVCALALLTPLIRSAVHRFATLACLLASLTRSVHGLAHSLCSLPHGTVEILEYVFTLKTSFTGTNTFLFTRNTPLVCKCRCTQPYLNFEKK